MHSLDEEKISSITDISCCKSPMSLIISINHKVCTYLIALNKFYKEATTKCISSSAIYSMPRIQDSHLISINTTFPFDRPPI